MFELLNTIGSASIEVNSQILSNRTEVPKAMTTKPTILIIIKDVEY